MKSSQDPQLTFFDLSQANRTPKNKVLDMLNEFVDFTEVEARIEATYSDRGRPGCRVGLLLRTMILQHLYGLSDPQAEEQLRDRLSFQKFVGLSGSEDVPDETTICRFRNRLISCGLHEDLLEQLNQQLEERGYTVKRTTLVDATLVESSRRRPMKEEVTEGTAPDKDASYVRKRGKTHYGYKAHVSADGEHHLIRRAIMTTANVDDGHMMREVSPEDSEELYADKAYDSKSNKKWLAEHGIENRILKKGAHHIKLTEEDREQNERLGKVRKEIERIFAHMKQWQGYRRVRYRGLAKNQLELTFKAVAYNLRRMVTLAS